ncbi:MAG TPA: nitroreductase family protein [Thermoleophilia bacterium]|nr:nitroreductase family protein [Thermoleophilia bacterium]
MTTTKNSGRHMLPNSTPRSGADPVSALTLDPAWYDAIGVRRSRRRYSDRKVARAALEALQSFCLEFRLAPGGRVALIEDRGGLYTGVLDKVGGAYGRVEGAPWVAAFIGPEGSEIEVGYVGEAFILEATRLGLGTCWVAGKFDRETAHRRFALEPGERVVAVTPVGHPLERKQLVERVMSTAVRSAARRQIEEIAPGLSRGLAPGRAPSPEWAVTAVEAARLAPSGANRQPWRFRLEGDTLVMAAAEKVYWTAPIDHGIAMLHVELGAAHEGVRGAWEHLPDPDVARFVPSRNPLP